MDFQAMVNDTNQKNSFMLHNLGHGTMLSWRLTLPLGIEIFTARSMGECS